MNSRPCIKNQSEDVELRIHCQPRASKTEIIGWHGDALKVRITSPPVDGQANIELCQFLARHFGVQGQNVQVLSGKNGRQKRIVIKGRKVHEIQSRLPALQDEE